MFIKISKILTGYLEKNNGHYLVHSDNDQVIMVCMNSRITFSV